MNWWAKLAMVAPAVYLHFLFTYPASEGPHIVFQFAVVLGLLQVGPRPISKKYLALIGTWLATIVVSTALSSSPLATLFSSHMRGEGALQHIFYAVFLVLLLREKTVDLRWLVYGGVGVCLWGLLPAVGWTGGISVTGPWGVWVVPQFRGCVGNPLYLATGLTFALWAALRLRWWHCAIPFVAAMVATQSKGALLGLVAAVIFWLIREHFELGFVASVVLALAMFALPQPSSGNIRLGIWTAAVHAIAERPLGWGAENFPLAWDAHFVPIATEVEYGELAPGGARTEVEPHFWHDRVHNVVLDRAIEWGWLGAVVWVLLLVAAWKKAGAVQKGGLDQSALVLYGVQGLFMFDMLFSMIGVLVWVAVCVRGEQ